MEDIVPMSLNRRHTVGLPAIAKKLTPFVVTSALAVSFGLMASPVRAQAVPPVAKAKPAKLDYKETRLKNGLKVVTLEDRSAPVVTVQVLYRVGSKEEPQGQGGFAHLFEHLMFKGSPNVGAQQHARYVESLGASYNAGTSFDSTVYYQTVASNALERMLFLEADRMMGLNVDEANLKTERDVVKEEYRLRVANPPYGQLLGNVLSQVYPSGHPYSHSAIGSLPDLDAAQLGQVQAFHRTYYRPDNATLIIVGDFKTGDTLKLVEKYFSKVPKSPTGQFPRLPASNAVQTAPTRKTYYDSKAPLPLIGLAYRLPAPTDKDSAVFDVIGQVLSAGQSSRLYRSLVRDKQVAVASQGQALDLQLGGLYFFFAIGSPGKAPDAIEAALSQEVERLRTTPITEAELAKAKNQVLTSLVGGLGSTEAKANALSQADLIWGNPDEANKAYEKIAKVTIADVQRVAQTYFAPERRNTFYMLPASMQPQSAASPAQTATSAPTQKEAR
jgi:zinc protease